MKKNALLSLAILLIVWVSNSQAQNIHSIDTNYRIHSTEDPFRDDGVDSLKLAYQEMLDTARYFPVTPYNGGFHISETSLTRCMMNKQLSEQLTTNYGVCKDLYYESVNNYQTLKLEDTKLIKKLHDGLIQQNEQIEKLKWGTRIRNYIIGGLAIGLAYYVAK